MTDTPRPPHPDTVNPIHGESAEAFWKRRKQARKDWNDWHDKNLARDLRDIKLRNLKSKGDG